MCQNTVQPPAAPNYAAANAEGVQAQLNALPLQNAINAAATLGTSYTDPNTGKVYDFTGLGSHDIASSQLMQQLRDAPKTTEALLKLQTDYGKQFAQSARDQLQVTDPTAFALRDSFGKSLDTSGGPGAIERLASGLTPVNPTFGAYDNFNYGANVTANAPALNNIGASSLQSFDNQNTNANQRQLDTSVAPSLSNLTQGSNLERVAGGPSFSNIDSGNALSRLGAGPQLAAAQRLNMQDTGASAAGRSALENQTFDELAKVSGGGLDPVLQRAAEQAARARGASTGNIMGNGSALQESLAVQLAQQQRADQVRANAGNLLSSGNTTSDTANRLAAANTGANNSAIAQDNSSLNQMYANQGTQVNQNNASSQQELANRAQAAGFNNAAAQQGYSNQLGATGFNNTAQQQELTNLNSAIAGNNASAQQGFANQLGLNAQNNQTALNDFNAQNAGIAANNASAQQRFNNQATLLGFNNAANQQGFQNQQSVDANRSQAAQTAFTNAMAAVTQRNQAASQQFGQNTQINQIMQGARQQDTANQQSYLGLTPVVTQGTQLQGLQNQAAPTTSGTGYNAMGAQANAGQLGTAFAGNVFGTQANIFGTQQNAATQQGLANQFGAVAGGVAGLANAYNKVPCFIARLVYGENNPKWIVFFSWKEHAAPKWFKRFYNRFSLNIAGALRPFPSAQALIRRWMDSKIQIS